MSNPRSSRRKIFVLALAGIAALVLVGFVVGDWPVLVAHYHTWRIQEAETYEAAQPWLEEFHASAKNHHAASAFVNGLRPGRERLMTWFFAWLEHAEKPEPVLIEAFEKRLQRDEMLLASWSHYLRWRRGPELWSYLSSLSPSQPVDEAEDTEDLVINYPCGTGPGGILQQISFQTMDEINGDTEESLIQAQLSTLGIAWFVGMWPLPKGDNPELALASWMQALRPFSRQAVHDDKLGCCLRDAERTPLPELTGLVVTGAGSAAEASRRVAGTGANVTRAARNGNSRDAGIVNRSGEWSDLPTHAAGFVSQA